MEKYEKSKRDGVIKIDNTRTRWILRYRAATTTQNFLMLLKQPESTIEQYKDQLELTAFNFITKTQWKRSIFIYLQG